MFACRACHYKVPKSSVSKRAFFADYVFVTETYDPIWRCYRQTMIDGVRFCNGGFRITVPKKLLAEVKQAEVKTLSG